MCDWEVRSIDLLPTRSVIRLGIRTYGFSSARHSEAIIAASTIIDLFWAGVDVVYMEAIRYLRYRGLQLADFASAALPGVSSSAPREIRHPICRGRHTSPYALRRLRLRTVGFGRYNSGGSGVERSAEIRKRLLLYRRPPGIRAIIMSDGAVWWGRFCLS